MKLPRLKVFAFILAVTLTGGFPGLQAQERPFKIPSLYHVGFWVRDVPRARAFYHGQLGFDEPYSLNYPNGKLQMVVMKVNERQVIYLFNDATRILPNGDNLDHLGLETDNAEAMRTYLLAHGVKVGAVHRGRIGDFILGVKDPDGHTFEVTQFAPEGQLLKHQGEALAPGRASAHLRGATISVADAGRSLAFYRDVLGFRVVSQHPLRVAVPDGSDYLELEPRATRSVPRFTMDLPAGKAPYHVTDPDGTEIDFVPRPEN